MTIHYRLNVQARVAAITQPIRMKMTREQFLYSPDYSETFVKAETHYSFESSVMLRRRSYGYLNILDQLPMDEVIPDPEPGKYQLPSNGRRNDLLNGSFISRN